jgi:hypothetical protein
MRSKVWVSIEKEKGPTCFVAIQSVGAPIGVQTRRRFTLRVAHRTLPVEALEVRGGHEAVLGEIAQHGKLPRGQFEIRREGKSRLHAPSGFGQGCHISTLYQPH